MLAYERWKDTQATLHLWTQIVGKIRLVQTPWVSHSWHVALYVTARGLATSLIPYGARTFEIEFDFLDYQLLIRSTVWSVGRSSRLGSESMGHLEMATNESVPIVPHRNAIELS